MVKRGKYDITMEVNRYNKTTTIKRVYNTETKEAFIGNYYCGSRKQYDKFFKDLDKDIISFALRKWIKPKDEMSEEETERIIGKDGA